ncbi:MAG: putative cell shape-determining protein [Pseudomonadota bacterium]|jgi:rod shape-determining protein MreC
MPLGTLDRTPPPFFKQGPSALSKLMVFSALAIFLMVADTRFRIVQPVRAVLGTLLFPVQWLAMQPVHLAEGMGEYLESLRGAQAAQVAEAQTRARLAQQSVRVHQVEQLALENERLRNLLELRERVTTPAQAAQVLYEAADIYSRKVIIDKGLLHGIESGSPVIDEFGVLGQVTRVYPAVSEVTLVTDRDQATPVLNARTGARSVAHGDTTGLHPGALELRFMAANADVQAGDLLTTSGVDGVYPPGLPVAQVEKIERRADSAFARIHTTPKASVHGALHVLVLKPVGEQLPPRPAAEASAPAPAQGRTGGRK